MDIKKYKLLIHSAKQIVQVVCDQQRAVSGKLSSNIAVLENGSECGGYSLVIDR